MFPTVLYIVYDEDGALCGQWDGRMITTLTG